jgi:uncharacterized protein YeaO (DUF488 family)
MNIVIKRAYDTSAPADGYRVLVDRLWPRGVRKEDLALNEWCKDVAPSSDLRKWFNHEPEKFAEFKAKYLHELDTSSTPRELLKRVGDAKLTLVYAAKSPTINHAVVLRDFLASLAMNK